MGDVPQPVDELRGGVRAVERAEAELPEVVDPQAQTLPVEVRARLNPKPAATSTTWDRFLTLTGALVSVLLPSPSWPLLFWPHAHTVPSAAMAREWVRLPATSVNPACASSTSSGTSRSSSLPLPSCPKLPRPQAMACVAAGAASAAGPATASPARRAARATRTRPNPRARRRHPRVLMTNVVS
ncbi:hypothetical protein OHA25_42130 [Nonomuraea sp. NBC_00507]